MALAKVYDTADTLMVPMDLDDTEGLTDALYAGANMLENEATRDSDIRNADLLRRAAEMVADARISAGLTA